MCVYADFIYAEVVSSLGETEEYFSVAAAGFNQVRTLSDSYNINWQWEYLALRLVYFWHWHYRTHSLYAIFRNLNFWPIAVVKLIFNGRLEQTAGHLIWCYWLQEVFRRESGDIFRVARRLRNVAHTCFVVRTRGIHLRTGHTSN